MYVASCSFQRVTDLRSSYSLSWADTAASTFGRLYGNRTPPLPKRLFGLFPLAPRKSLAGFTAASLTGAAIAMGFWSFLGPVREHGLTWTWQLGVSQSFIGGVRGGSGSSLTFAGWVGLLTIGVFAGLVTGIAEALGPYSVPYICVSTDKMGIRSRRDRRQSQSTSCRRGMFVGPVQDTRMVRRDAGIILYQLGHFRFPLTLSVSPLIPSATLAALTLRHTTCGMADDHRQATFLTNRMYAETRRGCTSRLGAR